ncbi:hypothetical protein [Microvirus mar25]|uniref:Uncharacterized protein n=1 Tax=Microvirus mar25 TaxID=2851158 RepID=A0A8F5ML10_9VIRU|nr:hypothetical protein [Microvirus mar25]
MQAPVGFELSSSPTLLCNVLYQVFAIALFVLLILPSVGAFARDGFLITVYFLSFFLFLLGGSKNGNNWHYRRYFRR